MKKKIEIATIPELGTSVGIQGSAKQQPVVGPACVGAGVGLLILIF